MHKFSIKKRLSSFKHAFQGFKVLLKNEHNSWIHLLSAIVAIVMGFYFDISNGEWIAIVLAIGIVISAEILNTSIEYIANFIQPNQDNRIRDIKDLGAAAVLIVSISALLVGLIIFLPKILLLF